MTTATLEARQNENQEREESRRILKVTGSQLISLAEAHQERICPGWNIDQGCIAGENGDELAPDQELCQADQRAEDDYYRRVALARQNDEDQLDRSQYR